MLFSLAEMAKNLLGVLIPLNSNDVQQKVPNKILIIYNSRDIAQSNYPYTLIKAFFVCWYILPYTMILHSYAQHVSVIVAPVWQFYFNMSMYSILYIFKLLS